MGNGVNWLLVIGGIICVIIELALGALTATKLVSTAAETYFKERAEMMRRLEVLNNTLAQNTKYIVPSNAGLLNVLGLDGALPSATPKPPDGQSPGAASPVGRPI